MPADFSEVELGFVVDLRTLRETLKVLNIAGRRWWLSSDPQDAAETGYRRSLRPLEHPPFPRSRGGQ
jgi:hypothetical protein